MRGTGSETRGVTRDVPVTRGKSVRVKGPRYQTEFEASGRVHKLRNIYQRSGVHGASANDKRNNAPANDRALTSTKILPTRISKY